MILSNNNEELSFLQSNIESFLEQHPFASFEYLQKTFPVVEKSYLTNVVEKRRDNYIKEKEQHEKMKETQYRRDSEEIYIKSLKSKETGGVFGMLLGAYSMRFEETLGLNLRILLFITGIVVGYYLGSLIGAKYDALKRKTTRIFIIIVYLLAVVGVIGWIQGDLFQVILNECAFLTVLFAAKFRSERAKKLFLYSKMK